MYNILQIPQNMQIILKLFLLILKYFRSYLVMLNMLSLNMTITIIKKFCKSLNTSKYANYAEFCFDFQYFLIISGHFKHSEFEYYNINYSNCVNISKYQNMFNRLKKVFLLFKIVFWSSIVISTVGTWVLYVGIIGKYFWYPKYVFCFLGWSVPMYFS